MGKNRDYGGSEDSPDACFGAPGQWDSQGLVKRAYDLLTALGLHCWMGKIFD